MISYLKKNINFFKFFFYFFFFLISFINFFNINVSILLYLVFIFVSFLCLRNIFNLENTFGIIIFSILVILGFWFKFSLISIFKIEFGEGVGSFDFSKNSYNEVLTVAILFKSALIFGHFIYLKLNIRKYSISLIAIQEFFEKKIFLYLGIILFFILSVCYLNFYNKIYVRGFFFNENFIFHEFFIKFFFKILASSLIYFSLDLIFISKLQKKIKFILIYILIFILSIIYISQLSREFGLHILIFIFSFILSQKNSKFKDESKLQNVLVICFVFWLLTSLYATQYIRSDLYSIKNDIVTTDIKHQQMINNSLALIFNRWVGIDAVMSIVSKSDKGWELFYNIKNNKVNWTREVAWPESKFFTNQDLQHVNIPGPAAFFYSSGSYIFLFFASFTIFIIFFLVEGIINLIKKNFIFLSHFLIFNLAYRIIHIGLSQNNDLYFILSNILIILFLLMLNYFYKFK